MKNGIIFYVIAMSAVISLMVLMSKCQPKEDQKKDIVVIGIDINTGQEFANYHLYEGDTVIVQIYNHVTEGCSNPNGTFTYNFSQQYFPEGDGIQPKALVYEAKYLSEIIKRHKDYLYKVYDLRRSMRGKIVNAYTENKNDSPVYKFPVNDWNVEGHGDSLKVRLNKN